MGGGPSVLKKKKYEMSRSLGDASKSKRADRQIVLAAVQKDGYDLTYAAESLRADREIVLAAGTRLTGHGQRVCIQEGDRENQKSLLYFYSRGLAGARMGCAHVKN